MFSVSTVLGKKASDVEQYWEASAKLPDRRAPPRWTGRGQVKEGIMFGKFSAFLIIFFEWAWSVYGNGCVNECLYDAILVRRLWTVE